MNNTNDIWNEVFPSTLADVLTSIQDPQLMRAFLRDVMTEKEIIEISARLRAAEMLREGATYVQIVRETKLSSRTIARISEWLQSGTGGYAAILDGATHAHTMPARAD
jgi:TrpR-related protein YerC/YecD